MRYNRIISYGRGTLPQLIDINILALDFINQTMEIIIGFKIFQQEAQMRPALLHLMRMEEPLKETQHTLFQAHPVNMYGYMTRHHRIL